MSWTPSKHLTINGQLVSRSKVFPLCSHNDSLGIIHMPERKIGIFNKYHTHRQPMSQRHICSLLSRSLGNRPSVKSPTRRYLPTAIDSKDSSRVDRRMAHNQQAIPGRPSVTRGHNTHSSERGNPFRTKKVISSMNLDYPLFLED